MQVGVILWVVCFFVGVRRRGWRKENDESNRCFRFSLLLVMGSETIGCDTRFDSGVMGEATDWVKICRSSARLGCVCSQVWLLLLWKNAVFRVSASGTSSPQAPAISEEYIFAADAQVLVILAPLSTLANISYLCRIYYRQLWASFLRSNITFSDK